MTEALAGISGWNFTQGGIKAVLAETEKDCLASHRTLPKNNFQAVQEQNNMIWWRLSKKAFKS
ncbi:hypothetical protein CLV24_10228 [Pontibacter ummariensis]|uniref:Uncharacterized protein n=2 Tax=Pontibacter ummariensis TaxID=1610492 RepID=A0A239C769_9BACT|nr:hypothetical protein CLV24_10228 [Pontibacter ummariensis]SNS16076.1 hypothetical protein SAMN06296052_102385 [Pontibacter ummariensis]